MSVEPEILNPLRKLRLILLALVGMVVVRTAWMCDDAYITLRTVDNFVHGYGLRWNVDERVQTFTHPLWLLVQIVAYFFTREAFYATVLLSIAISLSAVALLVFRSRVTAGALALAVLMLLSSRAFVDYSTSGLENPLTHLLIVSFLLLLGLDPPDLRRLFALSALAGLATLNRIDSLVLFAPGLVYAAFRYTSRYRDVKGLRVVIAGFLPVLLWAAFATFYYGFPYPNTAMAKLRTGIDAVTLIRHGFYYLASSLHNDPATLAVIGIALAAALIRRRPRDLAVVAGIVFYLLYVIKIGGDFMSGRFLSAPFLAAVVLLMQMDVRRVRFARPAMAVLVLGSGFATPHPPILSGTHFGAIPENLFDRHGVCDERRYYFGMSGLVNDAPTGERPSHEATKVGRTARRAGTPLIVEGAVGVTGFFAGPAVHVVDYHALGDPLLSRMPMVKHDTLYDNALLAMTGSVDPQGWRVGHYLRNVPHGYIKSLLTGRNQIEDRNLAEFYDRLSFIIRGPLWSGRRIAEIVRMNTGRYDHLVDPVRPARDEPIPWREVTEVRPDVAEPYYRRGALLANEEHFDAAIEELNQAVRLDPRHVDALDMLGNIYSKREDKDRAVACWTQAMRADPKDARAFVYLGDSALRDGQSEKAIGLFMQAFHLDPRLGIACNNIGVAYSKMGNDPEALRWMKRTLALLPASPEILEDMGLIYLDMHDYKSATRMLERALSFSPDQPSILSEAASAYAGAGDTDRATTLLKRAVTLSPQDPEISFTLGRILDSSGNESQALDYWRRSARLGFEPAQRALSARGQGW